MREPRARTLRLPFSTQLMTDALQTMIPVFFVIALGFVLRRRGFVSEAFWPASEKLVYYVFLPALLVHSLAVRGIDLERFGLLMAAVAVVVVAISLLCLIVGRAMRTPPATLASFHQASVRLNGIVGIAAIDGLLGEAGIPLVAAVVAVWVPFSNGLSIYGYVRAAGTTQSRAGALLAVLRNPVILSIAAGVVLGAVGAGPVVEDWPLFRILGSAALPVGLLAVGAALNLADARAAGPLVILSVTIKLAIMPGVAYLIGRYLDLDATAMLALITFAALPTSPGGYVVARQLGGDASFMATTITVQHLVALITLTIVASLMAGGL